MSSNGYKYLGRGAYSLSEVAAYTHLHPSRVRSWFKAGRKQEQPPFESDYPVVDGRYAASFFDLIDVLVAGQFRKHGVSMQVVKAAYNRLAQELGVKHAFCHQGLYTNGRDIFYGALDTVPDPHLREVVSGQHFFPVVLQPYLEQIDYSETARLAARWRIAQGVVIDPQFSFGKPTLEGRRVTTYVLAQQYRANDKDEDLVADLFSVSPQEVLNAAAFERDWGRRNAA